MASDNRESYEAPAPKARLAEPPRPDLRGLYFPAGPVPGFSGLSDGQGRRDMAVCMGSTASYIQEIRSAPDLGAIFRGLARSTVSSGSGSELRSALRMHQYDASQKNPPEELLELCIIVMLFRGAFAGKTTGESLVRVLGGSEPRKNPKRRAGFNFFRPTAGAGTVSAMLLPQREAQRVFHVEGKSRKLE